MSWLVPSLPSIPGWSRSTPASSSHSSTLPISNGHNKDGGDEPEEEEDEDLDKPPMFPLPDSAQRSQAPARPPVPSPTPAFAVQAPSPTRSTHTDEPASELNIAITPGTVPLGNMALPHSTTKRPDFGIKPGGHDDDDDGGADMPKRLAPAPPKPKAKKGKVALEPGHSALDWARLTKSGADLRGTAQFPLRVTPDELKKHNTPQDAWSVFNGKVYNITPYLKYHPGGVDELMRVAGRDGTKLFMLTHSWVNLDFMLQECLVGMLVRG